MKQLPIKKNRNGIAAIALAIAVAIFLLTAVILISGQGDTSLLSSQEAGQMDRAQFLAETGIQDAILKIARDNTFSGSYSITETDGTIQISITTSSAIDFVVNATATVAGAGINVSWAKRAQVTLTSDGKVSAVTFANQ